MQQWIALYLPNLPLEALTRALATPEPQAVAEHHRIVACDGKATALGVRPGLSTAAASALARELVIHPRNRAEETECLLGLAGWAAQYTPSVALELPPTDNAALALEVSGSLRLFRGLERIAADLRDGCARMGFTALVAAAPTARGASWLAHAGSEGLVADPAALESALADLPVRVMTGDAATLDALAAIGATRVGDVAALPRAGFARRFGRPLLDGLDRALGRAPDPRTFFTPPAEFRARLELPAEVTQAEALLFAARRLFVQLEGFLAARAGGVQQLALRLVHREARFTEVPIGLVAPARDAAHFTLLARERLGNLALPEAVRAIALDAGDVVPLAGEALALFDDGASSPGDWKKLVERLRARLGGAAVHGLAAAAEHRPERASRENEPGARAAEPARFGLRPFWLLPAPLPLDEVGAVPHRGGPLKLLAGPERIESGWWDGGDVARDYFVAETADRALLWIYRERQPAGGWYLHGLFA
ncbi:MAG: Y-family DNA polymerase [Bacteroidota bacterium]